MEKTGGNGIAIYSRKSRFTGKGESIENQIELCRQYIRVHIPDQTGRVLIYEDEGFSGGNTERPQFQKMMQDAEKKKFSAVVCYRLDRISRNIGDFANLIQRLNALEISFVSIREQFDTSSPLGRAMMYIASVFSQLERETIAERIRDNMRELAKTGRWLGGVTPTGYRSEAVEKITLDGKARKAHQLKLVEEEAGLVAMIFRVFLSTRSLTKTETYLIRNACRTKNGKLFNRFTIKNILENPVYLIADEDAYRYFTEQGVDLFAELSEFDGIHGIMAYNKTLQTHGKANQIREIGEWIIAVGRHPGIIRGADWIHVQELLAQNKSKAYRKPRSNTALLSGLLRCGYCGSYLRPKMSQRKNAQGERIYHYLCEQKEKSRCESCNMKNPDGNLLDRAVCDAVQDLSADRAELIRALGRIRESQMDNGPESDQPLARLRKAYEENGREIAALVSALSRADGTSAEDYILREIDGRHEKGRDLAHSISELETRIRSQSLSERRLAAMPEQLASFRNAFEEMSVEEKRTALRTLVERVVWDGERAHLYLYGSGGEGTAP